jgi:hypothetical protein
MEDKNINPEEYLKVLPKDVQDFILNGSWEERTLEIAKKYSLNESQGDTLANSVLLLLIGLLKPEEFLDGIIADLSISRLLAEQIKDDLEVRVFEYAVKTIENKRGKQEIPKEGKSPEVISKIPEIKPENLPSILLEQTHIVEPPRTDKDNSVIENPGRINYKPVSESPKPMPERVDKPISVPNFSPEPVVNPIAIGKNEPTIVETKPIEPPPKKYAVDPYREPVN